MGPGYKGPHRRYSKRRAKSLVSAGGCVDCAGWLAVRGRLVRSGRWRPCAARYRSGPNFPHCAEGKQIHGTEIRFRSIHRRSDRSAERIRAFRCDTWPGRGYMRPGRQPSLALERLYRSENPRYRGARALVTEQNHQATARIISRRRLRDSNPDIRITALRAAKRLGIWPTDRLPDPIRERLGPPVLEPVRIRG